MALNYRYDDEEWEEDWWDLEDEIGYTDSNLAYPPIDIIVVTAVILVIFTLLFIIKELTWQTNPQDIPQISSISQQSQVKNENRAPEDNISLPPLSFASPYDDYIITQGIHGLSYGHMAIDIAAGKGEPIKSPISGIVSDYFFDAIGNPTLIIENDSYRVIMLHGNYTVQVGQELQIGEIVGSEGNLGNTRDMQGRSCRGRDCGYHTHLNVFDKNLGININPLELISP